MYVLLQCMADGLGPEYQPVVHLEKLTVQQLAAVGNCNVCDSYSLFLFKDGIIMNFVYFIL